VTALLVLFGLFVLTPKFDLHDVATAGVVWGFVSGVSFAFVILMNRYFAVDIPPATIAACQNLFAAIAMLALLPIYYEPLTGRDWMILVVLGVIFTALAHYLFIHSLTKVRVQLASIISSMESIYGVAFAWLLLGERPTLRTCCGGALILAAVLLGAFAHSNSATEIAEGQSAT
jgi:drug/metabolite transporter (DMT)-like permease